MPSGPPYPPPLPQPDPMVPAWAFLRRHRHLTVPLALPPALAAAGQVVSALPAYRPELVTAAAVATAAMYVHAPHKWDRASEQWYARLSAAGACGWLSAAAWQGDSRLMLAGLCAGCAAWGIPWWRHKRPRDPDRGRGILPQWRTWWAHHAGPLGLVGSGVVAVTTRGVTETLRVQLWRGRQTARDAEQAKPLLESALGGYVPHGGIRIAVDPANPSQVLIHLRRANPLAQEPIRWTPDLCPDSVTEPAVIGMGEDGNWRRAVLAANWFVLGESRSGKSNELSLFLAAITGCPDAAPPWLIDRKGGRAARPWMPALGWCATEIEEARILLRTAVAEAEARAMHAYDGREQLVPTPDCPAIFVIIDETNRVTSLSNGDSECASLLAQLATIGQGVAVYAWVLTQYGALDESVRTEQTRSNLPNRIAFRMATAEHGRFALADYMKLDAAKLAEKGSFYCQLGPKAPAEPHRAPHMEHELVGHIALANSAATRPALRLYASDLQAGFDARWLRLPVPFRKLAPQYAAAVIAAAGEASAAAGAEVPAAESDRSPAADVVSLADRLSRIEADAMSLPDLPGLSGLALPSDEELRGELARRRARFARALMSCGPGGITPRELLGASGLGRTTIHGLLNSLIEAGSVTKLDEGLYAAVPGASVWDSMEAIRRGHDLLLAGSRTA